MYVMTTHCHITLRSKTRTSRHHEATLLAIMEQIYEKFMYRTMDSGESVPEFKISDTKISHTTKHRISRAHRIKAPPFRIRAPPFRIRAPPFRIRAPPFGIRAHTHLARGNLNRTYLYRIRPENRGCQPLQVNACSR